MSPRAREQYTIPTVHRFQCTCQLASQTQMSINHPRLPEFLPIVPNGPKRKARIIELEALVPFSTLDGKLRIQGTGIDLTRSICNFVEGATISAVPLLLQVREASIVTALQQVQSDPYWPYAFLSVVSAVQTCAVDFVSGTPAYCNPSVQMDIRGWDA